MALRDISEETKPGVFHAHTWGLQITHEIVEGLINESNRNSINKARLCLHPTPNDITQVTLLAFSSPYEDRIHKHPKHVEILIPIFGAASYTMIAENGSILTAVILKSNNPTVFSTPKEAWHKIRTLSKNFVMIEIGKGPFSEDSTIYF